MEKRTESNRPDAELASFEDENGSRLSYGSAGPEIVSVRVIAPRDCCEKVQALLAPAGFATSGIKEHMEQDGSWRFYFTSPVAEFRRKHQLFVDREFERLEKANQLEAAVIQVAKKAVPNLRNQEAAISDQVSKFDREIKELQSNPAQILEVTAKQTNRLRLLETAQLVHWDITNKEATISQEPELLECQRKLAVVKQSLKALRACPTCKSSANVVLAEGIPNPQFNANQRDRGWRTPGEYWLALHCNACNMRFDMTLGKEPKAKPRKKPQRSNTIEIFGPEPVGV